MQKKDNIGSRDREQRGEQQQSRDAGNNNRAMRWEGSSGEGNNEDRLGDLVGVAIIDSFTDHHNQVTEIFAEIPKGNWASHAWLSTQPTKFF